MRRRFAFLARRSVKFKRPRFFLFAGGFASHVNLDYLAQI
ncbi:hypothetical protein CAMSH0001_2257 [Campylobacter showae RM3277]|uniref:Uncharacterized protein n=1 Tax=Campylobacter showae RM3277 TaxID=553219 RepID=C6RFZ4_9BACT|nr:hypothetical protein CAMSH0001_2257 [Campylobacter showae RM3277]